MKEVFGPLQILIGLAIYAFFAFCLVRLAQKTNLTEKAWWGWVPVLQVLLMLKIAGVAWWWIFLLLIPFVNLIMGIIIWMKISEKLNKSKWFGLLMFIPGVDLIVLGYLALSSSSPNVSIGDPK